MTTRLGIAAICSVLITTASWANQINDPAPLVSTDIIATLGSDIDARGAIRQVLTHAMHPDREPHFFLASQIQSEWLPVVKGVNSVRLADTEVAGHLSGCGSFWIISRLERAGNIVRMSVYHKCGGTLLDYIASFDGGEWRLGPPGTGKDGRGWGPGMGSGFATPQPDCPCVGR